MAPRYVLMIAAFPALAALSVLRPAEMGALWRSSRLWAGVLALLVLLRVAVGFAAPSDAAHSMFVWSVALVLMAAGFIGARGSGRLRIGILTAMTVGLLIVAPVFAAIALGGAHTPQLIAPAVMLSIATILGSVGAMFGLTRFV